MSSALPLPAPTAESGPSTLGEYLLLRRFERGPADLFLACTAKDNFSSLALVRRAALPTEESAAYLAEIANLQGLTHPGLPTVLGAGGDKDFAFLAFSYAEGRDLRWFMDQCQRRGFMVPLGAVLSILREMIAVLSFADQRRLLAYDVEASGLQLTYEGKLLLRDFLPRHEVSSFGLLPTPDQIPANRYCISTREDPLGLVSLCGALAHELLTASKTLPELPGGLITNPDKVRLPQVPDPLAPFLFRALTPEPANHFRDLPEMLVALEKLIQKLAPNAEHKRVADFLRDHFSAEQEADQRDARALLKQDLGAMYRALNGPSETNGAKRGPVTGGIGSGVIGSAQGAQTPPNPLALIDQQVGGRYRVKKLLGIGGMGWVYQVEHVEIGRTLALKVLHRDLCSNPEVVTRFRREARSASTIGHPNIVEVTDFGTMPDGSVYCVMELINGIDLAQLLQKEQRVPEARVIPIGVQMCRALEAAHHAGIIHRDMKPANVILTEREGKKDFVKVLDFGIAKMTGLDDQQSSLTRPGMTMGTPQYMAPEQAAGKPLDPRADIYAVGAILYELLTGVPPFTGASVMEVLTRKLTQPPPPFAARAPGLATHPKLEALVLACLERKADKRPQNCAEVAQRLQEVLDTLDDPEARKRPRTVAPETTAPVDLLDTPLPLPVRKPSRAGLLLSAFAGAAILGGIGFAAWQLGYLPIGREAPPEPFTGPAPQSTSAPVASLPVSAPASAQSQPTSIPSEVRTRTQLVAQMDALILAGVFLTPEGKSALSYLEEAERRFPQEPEVVQARARFMTALFARAEEVVNKGQVKRAGEMLDALELQGGDIQRITELRDRIDALNEAALSTLREGKAAAADWTKKGEDARVKKDYNLAVTCYEKALSLNEKEFSALIGLARVYFQLEKFKDSVQHARRALKLRPKSNEARIVLADALLKMHDNREALDLYREVLAVDAENKSALAGEKKAKAALGINN